jgi:hypothetical protein
LSAFLLQVCLGMIHIPVCIAADTIGADISGHRL